MMAGKARLVLSSDGPTHPALTRRVGETQVSGKRPKGVSRPSGAVASGDPVVACGRGERYPPQDRVQYGSPSPRGSTWALVVRKTPHTGRPELVRPTSLVLGYREVAIRSRVVLVAPIGAGSPRVLVL